ncbi:MAG: type II toxin-antitoxin system PemK/MazF family toxin [Thermodesulfovibrionales bacterium]|nr:type II toxin-antitoxin system PemK/MazF family toxin [Nitrospinota bacterium]MCG2710117.1 type II toxin-antitoxin system PemK/MazF family toxin [Thermodesulfovibrionales bacterium]
MTRGDIYLVDFAPSVGAEIRKKRPALIISCNEANKHLRTVMVIPFSSKIDKVYPFEVLVKKEAGGLDVDSKLKVTQMRSVDKIRLKKYVGTLDDDIIVELEKAIKLHLAME